MVKKKRFGLIGAAVLFALLMTLVLSACFGTQVIISFNANGGKPCDSITVTSDMESITLPTSTKNGYDFTGWYDSRSSTTPLPSVLTGDDIPKESVTYFAGWKKQTVTITFTAGEYTLERRVVDMDARVLSSSFPSLDAYPDYEWKTDSFQAVKDTTVAAVRKEQEEVDHKIVYMIPGESESGFVAYRSFRGKRGTDVTIPPDPSPETQTGNVYFSGWFSDSDYTTSALSLPTQIGETDLTFYARFTVITDDSKYLFYEERRDGGLNIIGLTDVGIYQTSISIPSQIDGKTVLSIGKNTDTLMPAQYGAFGSTFLTRVILPSTLREVGDWAFMGCSALEEVIFSGANVTRIGMGAFAGCTSLRNITIPENVTSIGAYAFAGIQGVATGGQYLDLGLPEEGRWAEKEMAFSSLNLAQNSKLSSIGNYAFYHCDELTNVTLSAVMRDFNCWAFAESGIENVSFQAGGNLIGVDGVVYSRSKATLYYYPQNRDGSYTVAEETTTIAPEAFHDNRKVDAITLGDNVRSIGAWAFSSCCALATFNVGASAVSTIGENAFSGCVSLTGISFPAGVEAVGNAAFYACEALQTVTFGGDTLVTIGDSAFNGCDALRAFSVPASVERIGDHAFERCTALATLRFSGRGVLEEIGEYAFYECTAIGEVLFPDGVRRIGRYAFASEEGKMSLYFDNDIDLTAIEYYGEGAFMNTQIDTVTISANIAHNEDLGKYLFKNCTSLKQAYFSATGEYGYDTVPEGLFYGCTSLGRIVFTNNIKIIDKYAFYNCTDLETAQFGEGVTEIREGAFSGCVKLTNPGAARRILPVGLTELGERAFYACSGLTSVNIPSGITEIKKETFARCSSLVSINYDDGTTLGTIGENAFAYCTSLTTAMLPATLLLRDEFDTEGLVKNPFYGCTKLTRYDLTGNNEYLTAEEGVIYRRLPKALVPEEYAAEKAIYAYPTAKSSSTVRITPAVAYIDRYAFFGCTVKGLEFERNDTSGLTESVVLVYIDDYAFAETKIETATVSLRVYHIGEGAFMRSALSTLNIDTEYVDIGNYLFDIVNTNTMATSNVLSIGAYAFSETSIRTLTIPNRVTSVGEGAFADDYRLSTVTLSGGNVTALSIGDYAFARDNLLKQMVFPNSVVEIGAYALYYCNNIQTLSFQTDGTSGLNVGAYAFADMHYLYEIRLPANLVSLGEGVFHGDTRLKYIYFPEDLTQASVLELPDEMFAGLSTLQDITIPAYVVRVGGRAFVRSGLRSIKFLGTETDSDLEIGDHAFYELQTLKEIALSGNVVAIGDYAFAYSSLETFAYEAGKEFSIGAYAFAGTALPGFDATVRVKSLGEGCFDGTDSLAFFRTEGGIKDIPDISFRNCRNLSEIVLTGVESLGSRSFENTSIQSIESTSIAYVGDHAIYGSDTEWVNLTVSGTFTAEDKAFAGAKKMMYCSIVATGEVTVGAFLFENDNALGTFILQGATVTGETTFPGGASVLGDGFTLTETDSANANYYFDATEHVLYNKDRTTFLYYPPAKVGSTFVLEETVTSIGGCGFYQNAGLTGLVIKGASVEAEEGCFDEINSQLRIYVPEDKVTEYTNEWQMSNIYVDQTVANGLVLSRQSSGEYSVTGYLGAEEDIMIEGTVAEDEQEYFVTSIGENAFRNNTVVRSVVIGSGVKTVAGGAFRNCGNLERVTIGENVTNIKSYAFYGCYALYEVNFTQGGSLLSVGNYAFYGDISLQEIVLPTGVETIGIFAFAGCSALFDLTIGNGMREIGSNAFANCVLLPYVELPATMEKMGSYVFSGCEKLIYIEMKGENVCKIESNTFSGTPGSIYYFVPNASVAKAYKVDGVWRLHISKILSATERCAVSGYEDYVLTKNATGYTLVAYLGTEEDLTIVSEISDTVKVTSVGEYAIGQFAEIVTVSEGVTELKERAFYNATALTEISLPASLVTIGTYAFGYLSKLTTVTIADGVVFGESELERIEDYAFYCCYGMTSIVLPASVRSIGAYAFSCANGRTMNFNSITFSDQEDMLAVKGGSYLYLSENGDPKMNADGSNVVYSDVMQVGIVGRTLSRDIWVTDRDGIRNTLVYKAGTYMDREKSEELANVSKTTDAVVYVYVVEENAIAIGAYAFANNDILRRVTFGAYRQVSTIGEGAFADCVALEDFTLGYSPKTIYDSSVTTLSGDSSKTFRNCLKLTIFLPSSSMMAKYNDSWTVAANRQKLALSTYVNEDGFVFAVISNNSKTVTIINYLGNDTVVTFPQTVQTTSETYTVERIGREKASGSDLKGYVIGSNVTKVIVPGGVKTVGEDAFRNSANLVEVELPSGLTTIEQYAFAGCKKLTDINIPISVTTIEQYAFYDCDALNDGLDMQESAMETAVPLLVIGAYAFADCDSLESFYVPDHVKTIGVATSASTAATAGHTFEGCKNLSSFTFSRTAKITAIGPYVFTGTAITEITLPASVETVADYVFARCMSLQRVYLERTITTSVNNVTSTGGVRIFDGINNVHIKVYVPDENAYDLYNISSLGWSQKTVIVNNVSPDGMFAYTANETNKTLTITDYRGDSTELTIPRKITMQTGTDYEITTLGRYFANASITKVKFASDSLVTTLDDRAFSGCTALTEIHLPERLINLGNANASSGGYVFENCTSLTDITLPDGVTEIRASVFENCTALTEITLPRSINYISSSAFASCSSLARVRVQFGSRLTSSTVGQSLDNSAFNGAGTSAGGMTIIVADEFLSLFSGWTSVNSKIYAESDVVGDFVVKLNQTGTALILVQYLGDETELDLTELRLKGLAITTVLANSIRNENTKLIVDSSVLYATEYASRVQIKE